MFVIALLVLPDLTVFAAASEDALSHPEKNVEDERYFIYSSELENLDLEEELTIPVYSDQLEDEMSILAHLPLLTEIEVVESQEPNEETENNEFLHIRFQEYPLSSQ